MYQLQIRIAERPGARPAPWSHGMIAHSPAECWEGMMLARKAGMVCKVGRTVSGQMEAHDLFEPEALNPKVDLGGLV